MHIKIVSKVKVTVDYKRTLMKAPHVIIFRVRNILYLMKAPCRCLQLLLATFEQGTASNDETIIQALLYNYSSELK